MKKNLKRKPEMKKTRCRPHFPCSCKGSGIYGLGFIGSAVYYFSQASGFWGWILAFLKALVWPAFLVYGLLKSLGM